MNVPQTDPVPIVPRFQLWRRRWIFYLTIAHHLTVVACLISSTATLGVSSVHLLSIIFGGAVGVVIVLLVVSIMAALALILRKPWASFLVMPQQAILSITAWGAAGVILNRSYADNVMRSIQFITADQSIYIWLFIFHTVAFMDVLGALRDIGVSKRWLIWTQLQQRR